MFRRIRILALTALVLIAALPVGAEYFVIKNYDIQMKVKANNSYEISETIDVEFSQERHGIFRSLPVRFKDHPVKISGISVPGWKSTVEKDSYEWSIRIGDAKVWVNGAQEYVIKYTYDVGADNQPEMDEFYHNLVGLEWPVEIESVSFRITMPADFDASKLNFTSGEYGSTDNTGVEWTVNGRTITGQTTRPLGAYEGVTAALPLPEGYWKDAAVHREPGDLLFTVLGYPLFILTLLGSFLLWLRYGRDKKLYPSVEFQPPEGMNPAEIGYVIDGSVDAEDVTSLIIYWAQQGCLEIEEDLVERKVLKDKKILVLVKKTELPETAHQYEKTLFAELFSYGSNGRVMPEDLEYRFNAAVIDAQLEIEESFKKNPDRAIYDKGNSIWRAMVFLFSALPIMSILYQGFVATFGSFAFALLGLPFSMFLVVPTNMIGSALSVRTGSSKGKILFAMGFGGFAFLFLGVMFVFSGGAISFLKYLAAIGSGFGSGIFVAIMKRRTKYGDRMLEKTLGFREFIKTAEKDKLEELFEENPAYFYDILPYAMVLNLTDIWGNHFEGIAVEPPDWYRSHHRGGFRTAVFASTLTTNFTSVTNAMTSSQSSSSSSFSGGSSGGGSGGGGGGSW